MAYLNLTNEVAIQMMAAVEFAGDSRNPYRIWEKETTRGTRQLWEDRADEVIANLRAVGVKIVEA